MLVYVLVALLLSWVSQANVEREGITHSEEAPLGCMVIRVIGNDMPPNTAETQTMDNIRFILEHETFLGDYGCCRHWVVNRVYDKVKLHNLLRVLQTHRESYQVIEFHAIEWFRLLTSNSSLANLYMTNQNHARNAALRYGGSSDVEWVLPLDGNIYFPRSIFKSLAAELRRTDFTRCDYRLIAMYRITDNELAMNRSFLGSLTSKLPAEPQLALRRRVLNPGHPLHKYCVFPESAAYGKRNKQIVLFRLMHAYQDDECNDCEKCFLPVMGSLRLSSGGVPNDPLFPPTFRQHVRSACRAAAQTVARGNVLRSLRESLVSNAKHGAKFNATLLIQVEEQISQISAPYNMQERHQFDQKLFVTDFIGDCVLSPNSSRCWNKIATMLFEYSTTIPDSNSLLAQMAVDTARIARRSQPESWKLSWNLALVLMRLPLKDRWEIAHNDAWRMSRLLASQELEAAIVEEQQEILSLLEYACKTSKMEKVCSAAGTHAQSVLSRALRT